jgi:diguanylate cyclase (GGDEF)-like protein/PAS domain S-box-containing protein
VQQGPEHHSRTSRAQQQHAWAALQSSLDAVVCIDADARVLAWNPAADALLGWEADAVGREVHALLAANGDQPLRNDIERVLSDGSAPRRVEHRIAGRGGARLVAEATISATVVDGPCAATIFLRDVTADRRSERLREIEHRIARTLAASRTGEEAADELLELISTELEFDHAELWVTDRDGSAQRLRAAWRRESGSAFEQAARRLVVVPGSDLAGLGWEIGEAVCVDDAATLDGLPRAAAIEADEVRAFAALPMRVGRDVAAVLVLARVGGDGLDAELRRTLHSITVQLGQFATRRRTERRLQEETVAVAAVAQGTRQLAQAVDGQQVADALCRAAQEICDASITTLAVPDPETGGLVMRATSPAPLPVSDLRFRPDEPSVTMRAFRSRETTFLPDVMADPEADHERAEQAGIVSALLQPIVRDNEVLGVLGFAWTVRVSSLEDSTRRLVRLLADEGALALSRAELFRQLESAARTDPLTGLANIRAWDEHLTRELAAARRDGRPVAVAVLDLDGFKALNDERGHQHGDRILRTVAAGWLSQLREGDTLARLGGDEFAALLPGCRPDDAIQLAERLRGSTEDVTVSIGIAYWDTKEPPSSLRGRADAALYEAKAAGRDRVSAG